MGGADAVGEEVCVPNWQNFSKCSFEIQLTEDQLKASMCSCLLGTPSAFEVEPRGFYRGRLTPCKSCSVPAIIVATMVGPNSSEEVSFEEKKGIGILFGGLGPFGCNNITAI